MTRFGWLKLGTICGAVGIGCALLGSAIATTTLDAIDPRYRFGEPWRATERVDLSMFDRPTQPAVGVYSPILPWGDWARGAPTSPEPRFAYDDDALLGAEERYTPPPVRRVRAEPVVIKEPVPSFDEQPVLAEVVPVPVTAPTPESAAAEAPAPAVGSPEPEAPPLPLPAQ